MTYNQEQKLLPLQMILDFLPYKLSYYAGWAVENSSSDLEKKFRKVVDDAIATDAAQDTLEYRDFFEALQKKYDEKGAYDTWLAVHNASCVNVRTDIVSITNFLQQ